MAWAYTCRCETREKESQRRGTEAFVPGVAKADPGKRLQGKRGTPRQQQTPQKHLTQPYQQAGRHQHLKNGPRPKQRRPSPQLQDFIPAPPPLRPAWKTVSPNPPSHVNPLRWPTPIPVGKATASADNAKQALIRLLTTALGC
ncbi:Hypothetical protein FKW44_015966 [Caligus rogercresseyi]|uniref:Uncharacterized protein n=1 Tax=Caligus rogercresseyi TaxID=217165 RepID=A0A7T8H1T3_CALRO|nr:Hypothetical protein FKW44_015966 [Caligus rogercresseyi]